MSKKTTKKTDPQGEIPPLSLAELVEDALHEFIISAGMQTLYACLEQERTEICGPKHEQNPQRRASRAGHAPGELIMGGRRVSVRRPRARTVDGHEAVLPSWASFSREDPLNARAVEQMAIGVSTRKYARSLEHVDANTKTRGTSKSAVSRRFVAMTRIQLGRMLESDLSDLALAALMIDGVHFKDHVVLVALGIDEDGKKHILGLWEGATENATACKGLLDNLVGRGMTTQRSMLVVIDGAKGLRRAVQDFFGDKALVQRCQLHKRRNVKGHLPQEEQHSVDLAMRQAYSAKTPKRAKTILKNLARSLKHEHPSAEKSLLEGLDETLTVKAFGLSEALERSLSTTNAIENIQGRIRAFSRRVKRWRGGQMILRWVGAALVEASRGFRRLKGHAGMPRLVKALRAHDAPTSGAIDRRRGAA